MYKVDMFGDTVCVCALNGDAQRTKHDVIKWVIHEQAAWCNYKLIMEPGNLFMPFISQSDKFMRMPARKRKGRHGPGHA